MSLWISCSGELNYKLSLFARGIFMHFAYQIEWNLISLELYVHTRTSFEFTIMQVVAPYLFFLIIHSLFTFSS